MTKCLPTVHLPQPLAYISGCVLPVSFWNVAHTELDSVLPRLADRIPIASRSFSISLSPPPPPQRGERRTLSTWDGYWHLLSRPPCGGEAPPFRVGRKKGRRAGGQPEDLHPWQRRILSLQHDDDGTAEQTLASPVVRLRPCGGAPGVASVSARIARQADSDAICTCVAGARQPAGGFRHDTDERRITHVRSIDSKTGGGVAGGLEPVRKGGSPPCDHCEGVGKGEAGRTGLVGGVWVVHGGSLRPSVQPPPASHPLGGGCLGGRERHRRAGERRRDRGRRDAALGDRRLALQGGEGGDGKAHVVC